MRFTARRDASGSQSSRAAILNSERLGRKKSLASQQLLWARSRWRSISRFRWEERQLQELMATALDAPRTWTGSSRYLRAAILILWLSGERYRPILLGRRRCARITLTNLLFMPEVLKTLAQMARRRVHYYAMIYDLVDDYMARRGFPPEEHLKMAADAHACW